MQFIGWMYDAAREQSLREDMLAAMLKRSAAAGYNAVGLYLEHRFSYRAAPWAAARGCLGRDALRRIRARARSCGVRLIPFINTLGHMEGFIRSEGGQWLAESQGEGSLQICATRAECVAFARHLVSETMEAFDDDWVHLGGDETRQLGQCPACARRVRSVGKAGLYGEYYAALCKQVLEAGRRPCLWADMLIQHPEALDLIPRETILFDWQYEAAPAATSRPLRRRGFDVICCPSVQTYNAGWCHLDATRNNIDEHARDARALGALGVLLTTWELAYFTQYATTLPIVYAAGRRLATGQDWEAAAIAEGGAGYAQAALILGREIPAAAEFLRAGTWRQLRDRLVMRQNPFCLWRDWREEACGPAGETILGLCDQAARLLSSDHALQFPIELHRVAVEWVRAVARAARAYANADANDCAAELAVGRSALERLRPGLILAANEGGSEPDVARLDRLIQKTVQVEARVRHACALDGARPSFETIVDDAYVPGDQAAWRVEL